MNLLADLHTIPVQGPPPWTVQSLSLLARFLLDEEDFGHLYQVTADLIGPDGQGMEPHMEQTFIAPSPSGGDANQDQRGPSAERDGTARRWRLYHARPG